MAGGSSWTGDGRVPCAAAAVDGRRSSAAAPTAVDEVARNAHPHPHARSVQKHQKPWFTDRSSRRGTETIAGGLSAAAGCAFPAC